MEKEELFMNSGGSPPPLSYSELLSPQNWQSSASKGHYGGMSCSPAQFLGVNWGNSMDGRVPFEPSMSSFVSSLASRSNTGSPADSTLVGELVGRLGSLCPPSNPNVLMLDHQQIRGEPAASASNLASLAADPPLTGRITRFSGLMIGEFNPDLPERFSGSLLNVSANNDDSVKQGMFVAERSPDSASVSLTARKNSRNQVSSSFHDVEASAGASETGSRSSQVPNSRKRKGKGKEIENSSASIKGAKEAFHDGDSIEKRCKLEAASEIEKEAVEVKKEQNQKDTKPLEQPKTDYIHVRARRGQATDSHSLAERVRREKINERMKLLQDLVPGCNKVTGKALMLDEIINYVQSLQRQVELLSMKLAQVNPRLDFNMEALLSKNIFQSCGSLPQTLYSMDPALFPHGLQPHPGHHQEVLSSGLDAGNPIDAPLRRALGAQPPATQGHGHLPSQLAASWDDDLQSIVSTAPRH